MIVRTGLILISILVLCFTAAILIADLLTPGGFDQGKSLASFLGFLRGEKQECDCEYSSRLNEYICNTFCGYRAGVVCREKAECIV